MPRAPARLQSQAFRELRDQSSGIRAKLEAYHRTRSILTSPTKGPTKQQYETWAYRTLAPSCFWLDFSILMPAEPGRFARAGRESIEVSSDQQVNAGWQGPHLCGNYAKLWQQIGAQKGIHYSEILLNAQELVQDRGQVTQELFLLSA